MSSFSSCQKNEGSRLGNKCLIELTEATVKVLVSVLLHHGLGKGKGGREKKRSRGGSNWPQKGAYDRRL